MSSFIKNYIEKYKNKRKEGVFFLLLTFGVFVACQGALEDGNPFGPSTSSLRLIPNIVNVTTGTDLTFTPLGGTAPFSWVSSNLGVGTIIVNTGVFTGGATPGTATVTATDAVGNTATATVTNPGPGLALTFDVPGAIQTVVSTDDLINVTANSSGVGFTATIANNNSGSTFASSPTFASTTGTSVTITSPATLPTAAQGDQTFTITVTDAGNANTGILAYVLINDGT